MLQCRLRHEICPEKLRELRERERESDRSDFLSTGDRDREPESLRADPRDGRVDHGRELIEIEIPSTRALCSPLCTVCVCVHVVCVRACAVCVAACRVRPLCVYQHVSQCVVCCVREKSARAQV